MTDILYIVRQSGWGYDEELRYSLRALDMYASNVGRVVVCGDIPDFLADNVLKISCNNPYDRKAKNLTYRLGVAIESGLLGEKFLLSADDIYHLKPFDADKYPHFWKNGEEIIYYGTSKIARIINEARSFMQVHKLSVQDYGGGHCLHHVDCALWRENAQLVNDAQNTTYGVPVDLLLGAMIERANRPLVHTVRKDVKIDSAEQFKEVENADCFSTGDSPQLWGGDVLLRELYPNKSRWEK